MAKALNVRGEFHVSHDGTEMAQCQVPLWLWGFLVVPGRGGIVAHKR
jgi:hypothetical protein